MSLKWRYSAFVNVLDSLFADDSWFEEIVFCMENLWALKMEKETVNFLDTFLGECARRHYGRRK